jgi:hypothetical protein
VPMKVEHHFNPIDFVVLEMGKREKPPTHPWEAFPQDRGSYYCCWQGGDQLRH